MSSSYRLELDKWLKTLDVKADKVLDIGGAQLPIKGRTKSWDVKEYKIADLETPHANSPKPDYIFDLNEEDELPPDGIYNYDLIFCLEVFDYVWNPVQAFDNIYDLLAANGRAFVSFPFMYPTHQPIEADALRYTEFGIKKLAASVGLKILNIIPRRPETNAIEMLWRGERMRAAKNYDHDVTGWIVEFQV